MKIYVVALTLVLCACTTPRRAEHALSLRLDSYDQSSGKFSLTLTNNTEREALYLFYLIEFSKELPREKTELPRIQPSPDAVVMLHERKLLPISKIELEGTCPSDHSCRDSGTHAGIYACWSRSRMSCDNYFRIWSDRPLSGP